MYAPPALLTLFMRLCCVVHVAVCKYSCHKDCSSKVVVKCISKSDKEKEDADLALLRHRIPHRLEAAASRKANWCCHCGQMMQFGKNKGSLKCTECSVWAHKDCAHLVPNFCGLNSEMISQMLKAIESAEQSKREKVAAAARRVSEQFAEPQIDARNGGFQEAQIEANAIKLEQRQQQQPPQLYNQQSAQIVYQHHQQLQQGQAAAYQQQPVGQIPVGTAANPFIPSVVGTSQFSGIYTDNRASSTAPPVAAGSATKVATTTSTTPAARKSAIPKTVGLNDFSFVAVLGKGNFGKVMLSEERWNKKLYAIKVLKKEFIIENDEIDSIRSEKRVFLAANKERHPFLVNMHSCFQTESRIYFVMEYVSGGDLMVCRLFFTSHIS